MARMRSDVSLRRPSTPRSLVWRRLLAVVSAAMSLGVLAMIGSGMAGVADTYGDAFGGGWLFVWVVMAALASLLGVGAVVLWSPARTPSMIRRAFFWVAGSVIVLAVAFNFFGSPL